MKNKNNISEFQARNSLISGRVSRVGEARLSNAGKPPAAGPAEFDFNFAGGAPSPSPNKQVDAVQNDGFDF